MNKNIKEICFIVQARLNSQRIPNKMIKPFGNSNLFDILLKKLTSNQSIIPRSQLYVSVYENELKNIAKNYNVNIFNRSWESANRDNGIKTLFEWYDKLPYKYVIMISACHPFLKINTINKFIQYYIDLNLSGFFGVTGQRNYYWNNDGQLLNKWPEEQDLLNTKAVEPTYEAAHCLYASKMESIKNGQWVGDWKTGKNINFCNINEFEALDIDYQWQFDLYNEYFKKIENEMLQ